MTLIYRPIIVFQIQVKGQPKTDAILDITHRMSLDRLEKIMDIQRQFFPERTSYFTGEYVDVKV